MCSWVWVIQSGRAIEASEQTESMIYAFWSRFRNASNQLPESANITTGFMICSKTGGGSALLSQESTVKGPTLAWVMMDGSHAMVGNFDMLGVHI